MLFLEHLSFFKFFFVDSKLRLPRVERYTEKALLIGWLLELYLTSLAEMIDQFGETSDLIKQHRKNFLQFLSDPIIRDIVRQMKSTLYSLLHQHAAATDFNELARLIGDHEAVIDNAIQREDWPIAVRTLEERNNADLFYKYSSALGSV